MLSFLSFSFSVFYPLHAIPQPICTHSPSCPTLPSLFCFYLSLLTSVSETACHAICVPFPVFTSCFLPVLQWVSLQRGGVDGGYRGEVFCHHRSFCSPISIECSIWSVGLGRMLYGVEILRERNDGWESLSEPQAKHFLTSSVGVDEH